MRAEAEKARVWILEAANIVTEEDVKVVVWEDAKDAIERNTRLGGCRRWFEGKGVWSPAGCSVRGALGFRRWPDLAWPARGFGLGAGEKKKRKSHMH